MREIFIVIKLPQGLSGSFITDDRQFEKLVENLFAYPEIVNQSLPLFEGRVDTIFIHLEYHAKNIAEL